VTDRPLKKPCKTADDEDIQAVIAAGLVSWPLGGKPFHNELKRTWRSFNNWPGNKRFWILTGAYFMLIISRHYSRSLL
jgi:hypothetical protein